MTDLGQVAKSGTLIYAVLMGAGGITAGTDPKTPLHIRFKGFLQQLSRCAGLLHPLRDTAFPGRSQSGVEAFHHLRHGGKRCPGIRV